MLALSSQLSLNIIIWKIVELSNWPATIPVKSNRQGIYKRHSLGLNQRLQQKK